jgi:hypothetical protein
MTLQMKYDRPLAGILGAPFFSRFATRLDFAGSTLDVCDPDAFTPPRDAERIPFRIEEEIPMIDIGLQLPRREEIVAPVYVDTAASQAIVLNRPFVAAHRLEEGQRLEDQRAGPLTGSMSYAAVRGASVRIGSGAASLHAHGPSEVSIRPQTAATSTQEAIPRVIARWKEGAPSRARNSAV